MNGHTRTTSRKEDDLETCNYKEISTHTKLMK